MKYVVVNKRKKAKLSKSGLIISVIPWQQFTYSALTNLHDIPLFSLQTVKKVEQYADWSEAVKYWISFISPLYVSNTKLAMILE